MRLGAIAGIIDLIANENTVEQALLSMKRRGPFEHMYYSMNDKTLLNTSSSRSSGDGPFLLSLDQMGEHYVISFDGTIYNRQDIARELQSEGYELNGKNDAELVLRGFLCWKEKVLNRLNGVFSFAIFMEKKGEVFLARDRIGVKPLFYKLHENGLIFASEIKTILTYPTVHGQLDAYGAAEILLLGPGKTPGSGIFKDIHEIKPGFYGIFCKGNLKLHRYWWLRDRVHRDSFDETIENVRYLVTDAVRLQTNNAPTVGTMLSGGLDSSIVSALCAREFDARGKHLNTFSLDYLNNDQFFVPGRFQPSSDTQYIRIMQEILDSEHHWTILAIDDLLDGICDATIARDLPGMADVDTSLLAFCRKISDKTSIVLSGECADEIFGGYPWYRDPQMRDYEGFPWAQTRAERQDFMQDWILDVIDPEEFVLDRYHNTIMNADILPENDPTERRIKQLVNLNFSWFMQTLLDRGDRIGSYCNVDIRMPFCDYRIAEYLYGIPWAMKEYKGYEKGLLRHAMKDLVPDAVLYRKKSPFPKTYDPRYLDCVSQMLRQLLQEKDAPIYQIIRKNALEKLLHQDFQWPWYGQLMRKPQTIVYMLQINYWLEHYSVTIV